MPPAMIQLHYYPGNANLIPHILLRELDIPFELVKVDRDHGAHRGAAYLALNPNGTIPVLVDGDLVLYETAAICLHLADGALVDGRSDQALAPALGTPERAHYYKWMAWMTNTLQAMLIHYYYPDRMVAAGNAEGAEQVKQAAQARIGQLLEHLERQLASHGEPWLLGARYTALDPYAFVLCRWTRGFSGPAAAPARTRPLLGAYLQRMLARPAVQAAIAAEGLQPPLV
jgi:glutathione S-transferase